MRRVSPRASQQTQTLPCFTISAIIASGHQPLRLGALISRLALEDCLARTTLRGGGGSGRETVNAQAVNAQMSGSPTPNMLRANFNHCPESHSLRLAQTSVSLSILSVAHCPPRNLEPIPHPRWACSWQQIASPAHLRSLAIVDSIRASLVRDVPRCSSAYTRSVTAPRPSTSLSPAAAVCEPAQVLVTPPRPRMQIHPL